ncbi:MAG TPA: DUF1365 domain-containing protein [Acidothermaceae bacterium]|jgi:DUF1365 family protein|nr:DUF1365 domain-containing protein [Acidothermaceae bacterium]
MVSRDALPVERVSHNVAEVVTPALYRTRIGHTRHRPWQHAFRYRHPMWLVDVAQLPRGVLLGGLLRFEARDHLGDPARSIRANVVAFAGQHAVDVSDDRIVMLTNARMFGYVFNPISVFWCLRGDSVRCVIAEVHNTYGGRHCYFLVPDVVGRASVDKALYVSPFNPVDGSYDMRFTLPGQWVHIAIVLRRAGAVAFSATLRGDRAAATIPTVLRTMAHYPLGALRVSALIRYQGIKIFLRGLPVVRRPTPTGREQV